MVHIKYLYKCHAKGKKVKAYKIQRTPSQMGNRQTSSPINLHANKHLQIYFIYVSVSLNACLCTIFMSDPYNIEIVYWIFQNSSNSKL